MSNQPRQDGRQEQLPNAVKSIEKFWPTPTTRDYKGVSGKGRQKRKGNPTDTLANAVEQLVKYATPQSRDFRTGSQERYDDPARTKNLNDQIGGQLNPSWVEWIMGWPIGWTALEPITLLDWRDWRFDPGNQDVPRTIKGGKERVARLKAIGNGQVPAVVALAWGLLVNEG